MDACEIANFLASELFMQQVCVEFVLRTIKCPLAGLRVQSASFYRMSLGVFRSSGPQRRAK